MLRRHPRGCRRTARGRILTTILATFDNIVWSIAADTYETLHLNPGAERIYGRTASAFYADPKLFMNIVHPEDRPRVAQMLPELIEKGTMTIQYRVVRPGGEVRWLEDNTAIARNADGRPVRFDGVASDITERKAHEIDKFPLSAGTEGDPLKLAEERASTYKAIGRAKFVRTCSPTDEETSRIAREYKFSDRRRLFVDCPKCGSGQTLEWSKVVWDKGPLGQHLPETAGILCEGCGERWSESERREALAVLEFAPAYGWRQTREFTCCGRLQEPVQWDAEGRALCGDCGERAPYAGQGAHRWRHRFLKAGGRVAGSEPRRCC